LPEAAVLPSPSSLSVLAVPPVPERVAWALPVAEFDGTARFAAAARDALFAPAAAWAAAAVAWVCADVAAIDAVEESGVALAEIVEFCPEAAALIGPAAWTALGEASLTACTADTWAPAPDALPAVSALPAVAEEAVSEAAVGVVKPAFTAMAVTAPSPLPLAGAP
jgi:hypothetical protein